MVFLGIVAVVLVLAFAGLYLWTRRSEREIEIPEPVLTEEQQRQQRIASGAILSIMGGQSGGNAG